MHYDLYVITDDGIAGELSPDVVAERAIAGGADIIQLRMKGRDCRDLVRAGKKIQTITRKTGTRLIINDRLDVAIACSADGVHLGQNDMRTDVARQLAPPGFIIGVSVGTVGGAVAAEQDGADYVALSPVFPTRTKEDAGPGYGLERLREIRRAVSIPLIAIGGIDRHNVRDVIIAGADGIAVISAIVGSPDIIAASRELKTLVAESRKTVR
jgi:thiamine-phosphate pyrophosphorylase